MCTAPFQECSVSTAVLTCHTAAFRCPTAGVACPSDKQIRHIHDLPAAIPWLWEGQQPPVLPPVPAAAGSGAVLGQAEAVVGKAAAAAKGAGAEHTGSDGRIEAVYVAA